MKPTLTILYATLATGLAGFSLMAYISPLGPIWSATAFLYFVVIMLIFVMEKALTWKRRS